MKIRNNKGFTGIDIAIALIILLLFVSVVGALSYSFSLASRKVERKGEACRIIIETLEQLKKEDFETIHTNMELENIEIETGYNVEILVKSYDEYLESIGKDLPNEERNQDLIKIVTILVDYKVGKTIEKVEVSTIIVNNI